MWVSTVSADDVILFANDKDNIWKSHGKIFSSDLILERLQLKETISAELNEVINVVSTTDAIGKAFLLRKRSYHFGNILNLVYFREGLILWKRTSPADALADLPRWNLGPDYIEAGWLSKRAGSLAETELILVFYVK